MSCYDCPRAFPPRSGPPLARRYRSSRSAQALPGSWGGPLHLCRALGPRLDLGALPSRRLGAVPATQVHDENSSNVSPFGARSRGLGVRCLRFAGRIAPAPRKTRFRLVASLCRTGCDPWGLLRSVSAHHLHGFPLSQAYPGAKAAGFSCPVVRRRSLPELGCHAIGASDHVLRNPLA